MDNLNNKSSSRLMITNSANHSKKFQKTKEDSSISNKSSNRSNEQTQNELNLDFVKNQKRSLRTLQSNLTPEDHTVIAKYNLEIREDNFHRSLCFVKGFGKSALLNTILGITVNLPFIGGAVSSGLLFTSITAVYVWSSTKLAKFNANNFILSEDYENIIKNHLISDEKKQEIFRDAHARYEQAELERSDINSNKSNVWQRVEGMWLDQPEQLGSGVGLFFGFGGVVRSKIFSNTYKIWTTKARIRQAMLPQEGRIRFIPREDYKPNVKLRKNQVKDGFEDKFGNIWKKGPSRTPGEPFEWDIQLSDVGKLQVRLAI